MRISIFSLLFLAACSTNIGNTLTSFTAQIDRNYIFDLMPEDEKKLLEAERKTFDYAKANEKIEWRDKNEKVQGTLSASQIFKVGERSCRRFTHIRTDYPPLQATLCRREGEDWKVIK